MYAHSPRHRLGYLRSEIGAHSLLQGRYPVYVLVATVGTQSKPVRKKRRQISNDIHRLFNYYKSNSMNNNRSLPDCYFLS